jgi:hypothetical protein
VVFHQPYLYKTGQDGKDFSWRSLWSWYISAAYHSATIFFVTLLTYGSGLLDHDGNIHFKIYLKWIEKERGRKEERGKYY